MKAKIKADYIERLKATYGWARGEQGEVAQMRGLTMAADSADAALAGKMKLAGTCWFEALAAHGVQKGATMRQIAELPE